MEENSELFKISAKPEADNVGVPIYNVDVVYDINSNNKSDDEEKPKRTKLVKNACWNCNGSDHSLRQCKLPYDSRRVNQNKAKFNSRFEFKRYHTGAKKKAFPHLTPGTISDKLREALGLKENQLPPYIYRMRTLGYPPGWLLYAKTEYSGIEMFGIDGNRIPNADEEEGEITLPKERISYDESKIITYPGFNSELGAGIKDETKRYGAPELIYVQSKEEFIKSLKSINTSFYYSKNTVNAISAGLSDMEAEETEDIRLLPDDTMCTFVPPLPEQPLPPPPPPEPTEDNTSLENKFDDGKTCLPANDEIVTDEEEDLLKKLNTEIDTPGSSHGKVKSIDYGTPVLKIHSPYNKLPPPEAFQKNISDVINFENLPDSTGAYEKLKGVLKYARSKLSSMKENKMNNSF